MDTHQVEQLYINARAVGAIDRHVGARLRARRVLLQMSESWLAHALGLELDELTAMENGTLRIGPRRLAFITVALDVADRYFFMDFVSEVDLPPSRPRWLTDVDCWFRDRVSPHENLFLDLARRMVGSTGGARDLVHDVYAELITDDRWRTVDNPRAYIRRAVHNLCLNFIARRGIVPFVRLNHSSDNEVVDDTPGPDDAVGDRDHLRRVLAALDKLPPKSRRVMILRKIDGLSGPEIADRLGISLKGVEIHLTRGMLALNKHLEAADVGLGVDAHVSTKDTPPDASILD